MDFQSRINQFRQGLQDQQDSYNKLAANMAQAGRTLLPDKIANHFEYVEKIGGAITGISAGLHGGVRLAKRIARSRGEKLTKSSNSSQEPARQTSTTERQAETAEGQTQAETRERPIQEEEETERADQAQQVQETQEAAGQGQEGRERAEADEEADEPEEPARGGLSAEDVRDLTQEPDQSGLRAQAEVVGGDESGVGARVGTEAEAPRPAPQRSPATAEGQEPVGTEAEAAARETNPFTGEGEGQALSERATGGATQESVEEGGRAFAEQAGKDFGGASEGDLTDTAGKIAGKVAEKVGLKVGEDALGAASEAIPFVGEMVGLGMLIHGLVKAHQHEENGGGPKLSAPNPEATEQAGGFATQVVKGASGAPSIV